MTRARFTEKLCAWSVRAPLGDLCLFYPGRRTPRRAQSARRSGTPDEQAPQALTFESLAAMGPAFARRSDRTSSLQLELQFERGRVIASGEYLPHEVWRSEARF